MRPRALTPPPTPACGFWIELTWQVQIRELAVAIQGKTVEIHGMQAGLHEELACSTRFIQRCIVSVAKRWGPPLRFPSEGDTEGCRAVARGAHTIS